MPIKGLYPAVFAEYPLGSGQDVLVVDGGGFFSDVFNVRDLGNAGEQDFVILGPGSQAWIIEYAITVLSVAGAVTDQGGLTIELSGSFDTVIPFAFATMERMLALVTPEAPFLNYSGRARVAMSAATWNVFNNTGTNLTVDYQFWGRAA